MMTERGITPSQTVGPFFAFALTPPRGATPALIGNDLVTDDAIGEPVRIEGRVLDGAGQPVPDAMIEIWQADGAGRYPGTDPQAKTRFRGFGRSGTDAAGAFSFATVKPGPVGGAAPHVNVGVLGRGLLKRLFTRIYFDGEAANAGDPVLKLVAADRRATLIARRFDSTEDLPLYTFDIRLQGEGETVFFEA
jgi:protocatechuate 3,4-dioxygenase alpha subunit